MYSELYTCGQHSMKAANNVSQYPVYSCPSSSASLHTHTHTHTHSTQYCIKYTKTVSKFVPTIFGQSWLFSEQPSVNTSKTARIGRNV